MGLTLPRYVLQGQPFGCPNSFRTNLSNPSGFVHTTLSARYAKRSFDEAARYLARAGIVNPIPGVHLFALCATGPTCGRPNSFQTNLSNPSGFVHTLSARYATRPFDEAARYLARAGIVNPIPGVHPFALCATGPTCGRPNSFRTNLSNPSRFVHTTLSARYAKRPVTGRFAYLAERVGFEPTVRLHVRLISSQVHSTTLPPLRWDA